VEQTGTYDEGSELGGGNYFCGRRAGERVWARPGARLSSFRGSRFSRPGRWGHRTRESLNRVHRRTDEVAVAFVGIVRYPWRFELSLPGDSDS